MRWFRAQGAIIYFGRAITNLLTYKVVNLLLYPHPALLPDEKFQTGHCLSLILNFPVMKKLIIIVFLLLSAAGSRAQESQPDSALKAICLMKDDTFKVKLLDKSIKKIATEYPDLVLMYTPKMEALARSLNFTWGIIRAKSNLGGAYLRQSKYEESKTCFLEMIDLAKKAHDKPGEASAYHNISIIYLEKGDYPNALKYTLSSLDIKKELGNKAGMANDYNSIGNIYMSQEFYDLAKKNYLTAKQLYEELNDSLGMALASDGMSALYIEEKNYDEGLKYALRALQIRELIHDEDKIGLSYHNLGRIYTDRKELATAIKYYLMALHSFERRGEKFYMSGMLFDLAGAYLKSKDYEHSQQYLDKGLAIAKELDIRIMYGYQVAYELYEQKKDYKKAFDYFKLCTAENDSIYNINRNKQITEIQTKYEDEKREKEIAQLKQKTQTLYAKTQIQKLQINRNKYLIASLFGLVSLMSVISFLLVSRSRIRNKQEKLELEQKLLRAQMDPHFIFNALMAIQNFILNNPADEAVRYISSFAKLMRLSLENSRQDTTTIEKEIELLKYYIELQQLRFQGSFEFKINVDPKINTANTTIPPFLAQPFVENSLEHGILNKPAGKGEIRVSFKLTGKMLELEIEDNGIGRDKAREMQAGRQHTSVATSIVEERLNMLNKQNKQKISLRIEDLQTEDGIPSGTKVIMTLPIDDLT